MNIFIKPRICVLLIFFFGFFSSTAFAQDSSSISGYSGPGLTFSPPKNGTSSNLISAACDFPVTLTQSTSQTIITPNSAHCNNGTYHQDNSYWRVFTLSQSLNVTSVEIGIEQATATSGSQPVTVNIYENTGGVFPAGTRTIRGTANVNVSNQALTKLSIPITASLPSNAQMVVEVFTPSGVASGNLFFMGSNSSGQSASSYLSAANCGFSTPVTFTSIGFPNVHLVMNVIGCEGPDIYVRWNAGGANNGTSWSNAYTSFQDALDNANAGDEIWVAKGTYKPTKDHTGNTSPTDPRDKNFHLSKDLKIYGGFNGFETLFSQRDPKVHETFLSGDFIGNDVVNGTGSTLDIANNIENAYHVLILANLTSASVIDGFTIKGGNADGTTTGPNYITYSARIFWRFEGGGVNQSNIAARFSNITISGNWGHLGAGMYNESSSPKIINATFKLNSTRINGGGIYISNVSSPSVINSIFSGNRAGQSGGAINNSESSSTIVNSTFIGNSSSASGSAIINWNNTTTPLTISNSIFWKNERANGYSNPFDDINPVNNALTVVSHCMTQSFNSGTNLVVGQNPYFRDEANDDFRLTPCSPAINTGSNTLWIATGLSADYAGNTRPFRGTVDMGALECQFSPFLNTPAIFVKKTASGTNDGTSWINAYTTLQNALDNQCGNLDIWVAAGTYLPTTDASDNNAPGLNQLKTFHLKKDMKIYGGFLGDETLLSQRDWKLHETILSGDFSGDDVVSGYGSTLAIANNSENAFHVLITAKLTNNSLIEGFTIRGGSYVSGVGFINYASKDYIIQEGAGMYNIESSPTIKNVIFAGNSAKNGGGMKNESSSPEISSVSFTKNLVSPVNGGVGGGMYNYLSSPIIVNTIFSGNRATNAGSAIINDQSSPTITNATFVGNAADNSNFYNGAALYNGYNSNTTITNSIFWDNTKGGANNVGGADIYNDGLSLTISYSITQASSYYSSGTGIINNKNPYFVDSANQNFHLTKCSPAVNSGNNTAWTNTTLTTDLDGNPRPFAAGVVDMGAFEFQGVPFSNAIYVKKDAAGTNDGTTWTDAFVTLQDAIDNQCGGLPIWVASGTYYPTKDHLGNASPTDPRSKNFHLATDMNIYGGFAGTETLLTQRNWKTNETILSGDIDHATYPDVVSGSGSTLSITGNAGNAYHVFITANLTNAAVIDGFLFKGGNANGSSGGYITYATKQFSLDIGGGLFNASSSPTISNTTFQGNSALYYGGGCSIILLLLLQQ